MKDKFKPDFKAAHQAANVILTRSHEIKSFPCDIISHIKEETDIKLVSYGTARRRYGLVISCLGSEDALIVEDKGRYIIFYNERAYESRKKWSIAHEMGHFYLGHNLDSKNISEELRSKQEIEANFFAAQLLMPDAVIWKLVDLYHLEINEKFLEMKFAVSAEASRKRLETLNKMFDYRNSREAVEEAETIVIKFAEFINSLKPQNYYGYSSLEDEEELQKERDTWNYRKRYR